MLLATPSPEPFIYDDVSARTALADIPRWAKNQEPTIHSQRVVDRLEYIPAGGNAWHSNIPEPLKIKTNTTLSSIYRRLHPDKPSYTVTGSGGGGTHIYHWSRRVPSPIEKARCRHFLMISSLWFQRLVRKQIGMAVPVDGGRSGIQLRSFRQRSA